MSALSSPEPPSARKPAADATSGPSWWARRPRLRVRSADVLDVLVYLIVLGMFIQFFPRVIAESFLLALLTAILLKVVLELVRWIKKRILARMRRSRTVTIRIANIAMLVLLLPGSKFVVLELTALFFGDAVRLGGFWAVTALIVVLTVARAVVRSVLDLSARGESD